MGRSRSIFGCLADRGTRDRGLHPAAVTRISPVTIAVDLATLPFAFVAGLLG